MKGDTIISSSCKIAVLHKMEFSLEPNNCLRSSLRQVLKNKLLSDVRVNLNGNKTFHLHKSLLSVRSEKFSYFFDYSENNNDSDTFFSDKLKPILKKTTSVFEEKKYLTEFGKETQANLLFQERKPKSLKTIGWRLNPEDTPDEPLESESDMNLDSDSENLDLDFQLNEAEDRELKDQPVVEKKVIENQNGFLKFKLWKPSEKGPLHKMSTIWSS